MKDSDEGIGIDVWLDSREWYVGTICMDKLVWNKQIAEQRYSTLNLVTNTDNFPKDHHTIKIYKLHTKFVKKVILLEREHSWMNGPVLPTRNPLE